MQDMSSTFEEMQNRIALSLLDIFSFATDSNMNSVSDTNSGALTYLKLPYFVLNEGSPDTLPLVPVCTPGVNYIIYM